MTHRGVVLERTEATDVASEVAADQWRVFDRPTVDLMTPSHSSSSTLPAGLHFVRANAKTPAFRRGFLA
ncbi:hypothetical protein ABD05_30340 [Burkholderia pyrrocinia]|nr:hypothetical protein ABD05_30340 [Burkholderia pyrrocinia]